MIDSDVLQTLAAIVRQNVPSSISEYHSFLSGSKAEGLATNKSDYDIYVVFKSEKNFSEDEVFIPTKNGLVELNYVSESNLRDIFRKIDSPLDREGAADIGSYELILAHRVVTGIALDNIEKFQSLKAEISIARLCEHIAEVSIGLSSKNYMDALGNAEVNDEDSAVFNANRAIHQALDHLLASSGCTSTLFKWRLRNAQRFLGSGTPVYLRYLELSSYVPTISNRGKRGYLENVGRFIQAISDCGLSREIFPDVTFDLSESRLWGEDSIAGRRSVLRKRACSRIVAKGGKFILTDLSPLFEISRDVLAVWLAVDNSRTQEEIIEFLTLNNECFPGLSRSKICENIQSLRDRNIVY